MPDVTNKNTTKTNDVTKVHISETFSVNTENKISTPRIKPTNNDNSEATKKGKD